MADAHKNFAVSTVATAPSPATSGTSLVVASGHGTRFPAVPFNASIWPAATKPDPANAEIVRVTDVTTDTLTITRAQESTTARTVIVGDQIAATVTAKTLTDIEGDARQVDAGLHAFRAALADAANAPLKMLMVGDSITEGLGVTAIGDRWINHFKNNVARAADLSGVSTIAPGYQPARYTSTANLFGMTGDAGTLGVDGIGRRSWESAAGATNYREWAAVVCDRVNIFYNKSSGYGSLEVQIDGAVVTTIDCFQAGAGPTAAVWDSGALALKSHTVRITTKNTGTVATYATNVAGMMPYASNYTTGVQLWEAGRSSSPTWTPTGGDLEQVTLIQPNVVFICTGVNDPDFAVSANQLTTNMIAAAQAYDSAITGTPSFVFVAMWEFSAGWDRYVEAIRNAARAVGGAFVDVFNALGAPPDSLNGGGGGNLHPDTEGTVAISDIVTRTLGIKPPIKIADVQTFTASGTYVKPPGCNAVRVMVIGAGGGGGSGRRGAASSLRGGGGGGAAGGFSETVFAASQVGATETVTIAAGGAGGAAVTTDSTDGNDGAAMSSTTTFGSLLALANVASLGYGSKGTSAAGGAAGAAVSIGNLDIGVAGGTGSNGSAGTATNGGTGGNGGGGGGGGGGVDAANVQRGAGNGSSGGSAIVAATGGTGGLAGSPGGTGNNSTVQRGGGGGGGGGGNNAAGGRQGGDAGTFGAGGGGGGGGLNGFTPERGGNGSAGLVIVVSY